MQLSWLSSNHPYKIRQSVSTGEFKLHVPEFTCVCIYICIYKENHVHNTLAIKTYARKPIWRANINTLLLIHVQVACPDVVETAQDADILIFVLPHQV